MRARDLARSARQILVVFAIASVTTAWAEPEPDAPAEPSSEATPEDQPVEPAVAPEDVSGVRRAPEDESGAWLWPKRALLFVPRWTVRIAMAPPRLALWALDRYSLERWFKRIFFNQDGTYGLYPFVDIVSGFGATLGVAFVDHEWFDRALGTKVSARFGGRAGTTYQLAVYPNGPIGDFADLRVTGRHSRRMRDQFFGIGNQDERSAVEGMALLDPESPEAGIHSHYRHRDWVASVRATLFAKSRLKLRLQVRFLERTYDPEGADSALVQPLNMTFDTDALVGYRDGLRNVYGDLQGIADFRRVVASYDNPPIPGTGWLASVSLGGAKGWSHDPSNYLRYSADVRRYFNLHRGDRVLILRGRLLGVAGRDSEIPFDALPYLGGRTFLRGYSSQRFRDRLSTMASAEYQYPIGHYLGGHVFVDVGRVYPGFYAVEAELDGLRLGFGAGLDYRSASAGVVARMALASSIDGGIFFNLGFESVPDVHTR